MELVAGNLLRLPLFILNDTLADRDIEQPDLFIDITLNQDLIDELCVNPDVDNNACLYLDAYQLEVINSAYHGLLQESHSAQLQISHGPLVAAMLTTDDERVFVSPHMDFMPTFDLGLEDEE